MCVSVSGKGDVAEHFLVKSRQNLQWKWLHRSVYTNYKTPDIMHVFILNVYLVNNIMAR